MVNPPPDPVEIKPKTMKQVVNQVISTAQPDGSIYASSSAPVTWQQVTQFDYLGQSWPVVDNTFTYEVYANAVNYFKDTQGALLSALKSAPSPADEAKTALAAYVRLDDGVTGLGTGYLYWDLRGRVWQTAVAGTTLARLGNVRDLKDGGYGASYCGEEYGVGRTVLKQRYGTVEDAIVAVGLNHDLRVVRYAAYLLGLTGVKDNLDGALEAMRVGNCLTLLNRLDFATKWTLKAGKHELLNPYLTDLYATAKRLHDLGALLESVEVKPSNLKPIALPSWQVIEPVPVPAFNAVESTGDLDLLPYRARQNTLRLALESGRVGETTPTVTGKAKASSVMMATFQNGTKAVRKVASPEAMDHEAIAALVAYAFDPLSEVTTAPAVLRLDEKMVLMEVVSGVASKHFEYGEGCSCCTIARLVEAEPKAQAAAVMMTSLDFVIANSDRHCDNLLLGEDFRFGLIDHAYSLDLDKFQDANCLSLHGWRESVTHAQVNRWEANVRSIAEAINAEPVARAGVDLASQVLARLQKLRELATV